MKEQIEYDFSDCEMIAKTSKALSSPVRIHILNIIKEKPMNMSEISEKIHAPISSTAMHIRVLEEAGFVITQSLPGVRGSQRVCALKAGQLTIHIVDEVESMPENNFYIESMPIGNYFDCDITPPCGIASENNFLSSEDSVYGFYSPERHTAQLLWFSKGYLEYRFSSLQLKKLKKIKSLEFSFEICSEAPGYDNTWKSDITFSINHIPAGIYTSPGDFGGRHGKLSPEWWDDNMTQFGSLKTLQITDEGTYMDGSPISDYTIEDYHLTDLPYISLKIEVREDAYYVGGLNLFGEKFGDYKQNIIMRIVY